MRVVRLPVCERLVARLPLWAVAVVAVLCVAGGVVLTLSPFTSVEVLVLLAGINAVATGVLLLVSHDEATPWYPVLLGLGWLALGVVILAWPGLSVAALAIVIGVALVATGLVDVARTVAGRQQSERSAAFIGGLVSIVIRSLERVEALEPPAALPLPEWLRRPRAADPDALHLRAAVTARGMKELDWSAFGDALVQEADGSGRIDMAIPVSSLDFHARLFLRLGREATIASPPELIAVLRREAHAILSLYPA